MLGPIAELQTVQHRIAEIELLLLLARTLLYDTAERWQRHPEQRDDLGWRLAAVKYTVSNHAIRVGDLALRVVGSAGLSRALPLERYVRDLRVSIGQPPIDDAASTLIGRAALGAPRCRAAPWVAPSGRSARDRGQSSLVTCLAPRSSPEQRRRRPASASVSPTDRAVARTGRRAARRSRARREATR